MASCRISQTDRKKISYKSFSISDSNADVKTNIMAMKLSNNVIQMRDS